MAIILSPIRANQSSQPDLRNSVMDCIEASIQQIDKEHFISRAEIRNFLWRYKAQDLALIHIDLNEICQNSFAVAERNKTLAIAKSFKDFSDTKAVFFNTEHEDLSSMKACLKQQANPEHWKAAFHFIERVRLAVALKEGFYIVHNSDETLFQHQVKACITDHYGYNIKDYSC